MSADPPEDEEGPEDVEPVVLPVTGEIDLHSFAPRDVVSAAEAYLDACAEEGLTEVRLVHGKGRGVQRAALWRMLRERPDVASFGEASPASGGWGATLVNLLGQDPGSTRTRK